MKWIKQNPIKLESSQDGINPPSECKCFFSDDKNRSPWKWAAWSSKGLHEEWKTERAIHNLRQSFPSKDFLSFARISTETRFSRRWRLPHNARISFRHYKTLLNSRVVGFTFIWRFSTPARRKVKRTKQKLIKSLERAALFLKRGKWKLEEIVLFIFKTIKIILIELLNERLNKNCETSSVACFEDFPSWVYKSN